MTNKINEKSLYEPIKKWLQKYLEDHYKSGEVVVINSHSQGLDKVLLQNDIQCDVAIGIDIQIDVLGIVKKADKYKLFFVEAKAARLTLRDLGQLWAYVKLINPEEAFLITSENFGSLDKILKVFKREDMLDFGDGKQIKKIQVLLWDLKNNLPDLSSKIPKI
ncbi:MAG: hypothetical protein LBT79_02065 [Elusimicrobiota bacterium]|jgi:hypothetical protein|nr:hypothetical protein [Elusimicrobiota bacterium]